MQIANAYSRGCLIAAARVVGDLGHTDLDDLLLEWGIDDLVAGRELGSRAQRGVAIGSYVVSHPLAQTADGVALSDALVRRAMDVWWKYGGDNTFGPEGERRNAFAAALPPQLRALLNEPIYITGELDKPMVQSDGRPPIGDMGSTPPATKRKTNKVFLVHGRDDHAKTTVTLFLERLGLDVTILHEQPNSGRTLLNKFLDEAADADFAVVLMTGDDMGRLAADTRTPPTLRARQNVVFELGFFTALIGPANVCALVADGVERPSDFESVVYVAYGPHTKWQQELARELKAAHLQINTEALLR